ncbi:MAG: hypothetical protein AAGF97_13860 [Planctomycetota bacterium]
MSKNPYAAPTTSLGEDIPEDEFLAIRSTHLRHEASLKSMGLLFQLAGTVSLLLAVAGLLAPVMRASPANAGLGNVAILLLILVGALSYATGFGLRRLRPWARLCAIFVGLLCLMIFPFGTLLSAYFLFLLLSGKANVIFSKRYLAVIAHTPQLVDRTSRWVLTVGLLVLILMFLLPVARLLLDAS